MPSTAPTFRTINDLLFRVVDSNAGDVIRVQEKGGNWQILSSAEFYTRVRALARALRNLGIAKGDRVALISENRWEWAVTDFTCLAMGAVDVPLFPTLQPGPTGDMLAHSGARVAIVSTKAQFTKVASIRERTALEHIVLMDELPEFVEKGATLFSTLMQTPDEPGDAERFRATAEAITGEDLASIIYTSGTTSEPKGVMLTHNNLASNVNYSLRDFQPFLTEGAQRTVSFLPLSHVTARHADYALYTLGFSMAYCPSMDKLMGALKAVKPTLVIAVPRVYERVRQEIERRSGQSKVKSAIVKWALGVGRANETSIHEGRVPGSPLWKLADRLFYSKVREVFGGEVKFFVAGGAPLGLDSAHWFAQAGIRILEGYGLTETSPVIAVNTPGPGNYRLGTVGKPLPNLECRIAEDGELLVRGPNVFHGYWQSPELTRQAFDPEGWFLTGDIGNIDADGFLSITDRKKELIKTSAGKFISPQIIEGKLKADLFVGNAAVVGDRQKYVAALISPNFPILEAWAKEHKIEVADRQALVDHPEVQARYKETIRQVNKTLADFELLKNFALVPDEWGVESGELTPSMKLKRRIIDSKYPERIASLFR